MITEKKDGMKNSKEKRKLNARKWRSGKVLMNMFFLFRKNQTRKDVLKNICKSITCEDELV